MGLGWFALSAWLVNGWIRVARALGLQGECRINVHPEAEERERASPKIAVSLSCSPVTQCERWSCCMQHSMCPHIISNSCDTVQQEVLGSGDNAKNFYHSILVQHCFILT